MFVDRAFKSLKTSKAIFSSIVTSLIKKEEADIETSFETVDSCDRYFLSNPDNVYSTLERELDFLRGIYTRTRIKLEKNDFHPRLLSAEEELLLNKSNVVFTVGRYTNYIVRGYSDGDLLLRGPISLLTLGPNNELISVNPDIKTDIEVPLRFAYQYIKIQCTPIKPCLMALALENPFFAKQDLAVVDKIMEKLAEEIAKGWTV